MGLALIIIGLILWLVFGFVIAGIICLVIGLVLLFVPGAPYGYGYYRDRRRPPP
jgi:hypothetical protein